MSENDTPQSPLRTEHFVADWLGVKPGTLRKWRYENRGPDYVKIHGRLVRYRDADVHGWIAEQQWEVSGDRGED